MDYGYQVVEFRDPLSRLITTYEDVTMIWGRMVVRKREAEEAVLPTLHAIRVNHGGKLPRQFSEHHSNRTMGTR